MAFDLSELMKDVSKTDTGREQIIYVPYAALLPDQNNGYSMDGIEELARSIELVGLQQPLRVRTVEGEPTVYGIVSGHRRHAAIALVRKRNPKAFSDGVPCILDRDCSSAALRELKLILGNADNRVNTPADNLRNINGLADCLRRLEAEGYHFSGRHRDWIAKMIGMSKTNIGRLQAIGKHLAPSLMDHFNAGELGVTAAYRLSQEPEQIQHDVYRILGKGINDLTEAQLEERINRAKAPRPDPRITTAPAESRNEKPGGFDVDEYLENRRKEDDEYFEMLSERAEVFVDAVSAVNSRSEGIETLKKTFGSCYEHSGGPNMVCYDAKPKGLTLYHEKRRKSQIFRTWTEVYDMLCTIALNRAAIGGAWDDEDEEEEALPVVRWESRAITPPQREQLLLYQLTNAGPKFTPAVYCGGAVFRKPAWAGQTGAELTGIAQQFSHWLKIPDPNSYGEEYRLAPPESVPGTDTTPAWQTGKPPKAGLYYCKFGFSGKCSVMKWLPDRECFVFPNTNGELSGELPEWWPLPD